MTDPRNLPPDWAKVEEGMARQILYQGETYMRAQLQVGLDADKRAMTLASILSAAATAVLAANIVYYNAKSDFGTLLTGFLVSAMMLVASGLCFWTARPRQFFLPGNHPEKWWAVATGKLSEEIGGETENYQDRIVHNDDVLRSNGRVLVTAISIAIAAPVCGIIFWLFNPFSSLQWGNRLASWLGSLWCSFWC